MKYRPEVDGLRAVAILGVLVYHLRLFPLSGGYLGVDVFFVISGYLITSLIIREIESTRAFSFSDFYLRRVRRIVPALLAMLLAAALAGQYILVGPLYGDFYRSVLAAYLYCANIFYYFGSGYWDFASSLKPLLHTWSLGIEEQFYLLFPLLAWALMVKKKASKYTVLLVFVSLSLLSWLIFKKLYREYPEFTFYLLPTRLWELTAGCAVASFASIKTIRLGNRAAGIVAAAAISAILTAFCLSTPESSRWHGIVVAAAAALIALPLGPVKALLACRPFIWVGKMSYSLYLWHWPLWVFATFRSKTPPSYALSLFLLGTSLLAAYLSWRFIEQPFRKIGTWRRLVCLLAAPSLLLIGFTFCQLAYAPVTAVDIPEPSPLQALEVFTQDIDRDDIPTFGPEGTPAILLTGDSHAMALAPAFAALSREYGVTSGLITRSSTTIFAPALASGKSKRAVATAALAFIRRHDIKTVVIAQRWTGYPETEMEKAGAEALRELLAEGRKVYLVEEVPNHPEKTIMLSPFEGKTQGPAITRPRIVQALYTGIAQPGLHIIRTADCFKSGTEFVFVHDNRLLYRDGHHLNVFGAEFVKPALRPIFEGEPKHRTGQDVTPELTAVKASTPKNEVSACSAALGGDPAALGPRPVPSR